MSAAHTSRPNVVNQPSEPAPGDNSFLQQLRAIIGQEGQPRWAKDPITEGAIRIWCEAVDDYNPAYQDRAWAETSIFGGIVAPATSLNMWTLPGNRRAHPPGEPLDRINEILFSHGFTSVAAVNNDQQYFRPLRPGDRLQQIQHIGAVSEEKTTALGRGHFLDLISDYRTEDGDLVGRVLLRMLRWNPETGPVASDTADADQQTRWLPPLRPSASSAGKTPALAAGSRGTVIRTLQPLYAVNPRCERPYLIAEVELSDGQRLVTDLVDVEPDSVTAGMSVTSALRRTSTGEHFPVFMPSRPAQRQETLLFTQVAVDDQLAPWPIPLTQLSIAALATATFDFNDVHLDRDAAVQRGARDVYMNILGSTALVNCYLTDWAGPESFLSTINVRLMKQNHPGDTMTLVGRVTDKRTVDGRNVVDLEIRGYNSLGDHLRARCSITLG